MIWLTTYDMQTKIPTAASVPLGVKTIDEAEGLMPGKPTIKTVNTSIYAGGVCLSWIRFSMTIDILES